MYKLRYLRHSIENDETFVNWLSAAHVDECKCHGHTREVDGNNHYGLFDDARHDGPGRARREAYGICFGAGIELEMLIPLQR